MILNINSIRVIYPVIKAAACATPLEKVLIALKRSVPMTANEIMRTTELASGVVYRALQKLEREGEIIGTKETVSRGNPVKFRLTI